MTDKKRWWISWYEPMDETADYRPLKWPLSDGVIGYWSTGLRMGPPAAVLCAVVDAPTQAGAEQLIKDHGWNPESWRFCEEQDLDWMPNPDRFPTKETS